MDIANKRIYLSPPHMGVHEQGMIAEAFLTNWIAPVGPHVDLFEKEVADLVGVRGAVALNSGTAAIHLAIKLLGVGEGDTVFCSSLTFIASANPILYEKAQPIFIDSEPTSWNMSPYALKRALAEAAIKGRLPKAVIIVNLYGQSADMEVLKQLCDDYGVPIIEDAAESLGATYKGQPSGTIGTFGVYSFSGNKIITTSCGGMLVSNDLEALDRARFWATQSRDPACHYQHSQLGYNYRLSNILAGIGRGQLRVLDERIEQRRAIFRRYEQHLSGIPGFVFMPEMPYGSSNRWLTTLTVDPTRTGVSAYELVKALAAANIESRPVWKPLHMQPLYENCLYYPHQPNVSISETLFRSGICLPSGSNLSQEEQDRVIYCIQQSVGKMNITSRM